MLFFSSSFSVRNLTGTQREKPPVILAASGSHTQPDASARASDEYLREKEESEKEEERKSAKEEEGGEDSLISVRAVGFLARLLACFRADHQPRSGLR